MSKQKEYVSTAGLRLDGRRPHEARQVKLDFNCSSAADGSCTLTSGGSRVCATVLGPQTSDMKQQNKPNEGTLTCAVAVAASAGNQRKQPQRNNRHCDDIAASILQVMRSVVLLTQYPNSLIHVEVEILRLDGNEKTLGITAACLALANARVAMRDVVCAFTVGLIDQHLLMDLTTEEIRSDCPLLSIAFAGHSNRSIVWVEGITKVAPDMLKKMMDRAQECSTAILKDIQASLREEAEDQEEED